MKKLLMLKGLPASGKSTYARELAAASKYVRVNKDDLRAMLHGGKWSKTNEAQVIRVRDSIIKDALLGGMNVVVDDTNFHESHPKTLRALAKQYNAEFVEKYFECDVEECIKRDLARPVSVGEKVIRRMYEDYLAPKPQVYQPDDSWPKAVIVDIDGTLAHGIKGNGRSGHRGAFEWHKVKDDVVDQHIKELVNGLYSRGYHIVVVSGRDGVAYDDTAAWLESNGVEYDELHLRAAGDNRNDAIFKKEVFDTYIDRLYNVHLVIDDRDRVVKMWRSLGLKVLQVAEGNF